MGLDEQRMAWAIGLAATQPVGLREMFGTMTKSFHPGRAAQSGLLAALLAEQGYTSSDAAIEAKRGWANVLSTKQDYSEITGELGSRSELMLNSYKPFACGIVIHPAIDACIQLRTEHAIDPEQIASVELKVHPLVLELTGKRTPKTGLDGKFSVFHSAAVALIYGRGGEAQYSDAMVADPRVIALRDTVDATIDEAMPSDAVDATVILKDGTRLHKHVDHAIGSVDRPMSEADLIAKFDDLVAPVLGAEHGAKLREICLALDGLADAGAVAREARLPA
jgi:2-methylcitrate dehydratase PrpD